MSRGARGAGEVVLDAPPPLGPLYARALAGAALTRAGRRREPVLPDLTVVVPAAPVEADRVARYARVCGFALRDAVPVTYPHLLAFGAQVHLMAAHPFPVPLLGLVHLRQVVVQHRPLRVGERPAVRVRAERLALHARGATVDLVARLELGGEPVWEGRSTYLARGATAPADGPAAAPAPEPPAGPATALWPVGAATGRQYAAVSGDVNPIHLSALTARPLGYPRAIAHGMWTMARTAAALAPRLPGAVTLDVAFARPVSLPSTVALLVRPVDEGFDVAVRSRSMTQLHLAGTARAGARPV